MEIIFDNKNKKKLYELNQNIKYVFPVGYSLFPTGEIISEGYSIKNIFARITSLNLHPSMNTSILNIYSKQLYEVFKDNKRANIISMEIHEESDIVINTLDEKNSKGKTIKNKIGDHRFINNQFDKKNIKVINEWNNYILNSSFIELDKDLPEKLKNNRFQIIDVNSERVRLTRSIFPGIKAKDTLYIATRDNKDKKLFDVLFKIQRESIEIYFSYTCVRL